MRDSTGSTLDPRRAGRRFQCAGLPAHEFPRCQGQGLSLAQERLRFRFAMRLCQCSFRRTCGPGTTPRWARGASDSRVGWLTGSLVGASTRVYPRLASGLRRCAQSKAANLLDRLENSDLCVLAFLFDKRVPFTNNQGEQYIRMIKVRQKISGCFRTLRGAQIFCRIRSYLSTCRKQGRNVWEAIQMAVTGRPFIPSAPHAGP